MGNNKYVDFVDDKFFLECVREVCEVYYREKKELTVDSLKGNGLDPFKSVFDMANRGISFEQWMEEERSRQEDKTLNNKIGEFHQKLLGGVKGWTDLGVGNDTELDLKKDDDTIFMEIKNKYNTINSDSGNKVRDKLGDAARKNPKAIVYFAYIISKKNDSGEKVWKKKGRETNVRIKKIWGSKVYALVTEKEDALKKTWEALPIAINDYMKGKAEISEDDKNKLVMSFGSVLG